MARIAFADIASVAGNEFADHLSRHVQGTWEAEWNTEDDFVAEEYGEAEEAAMIAEFLSKPEPKPEPKAEKPGRIISTHWGPLEPSADTHPILAKHWF